MSARPIVHIEIPSADHEATEKFYSELFGWKFETAGPPYNYTMFQAGNTGGGLMPPEQAKPGEIYLYIHSDDIEADVERIKAAGGEIEGERMDIPEMGSLIMFKDPTGNKICLWKSAHPQE